MTGRGSGSAGTRGAAAPAAAGPDRVTGAAGRPAPARGEGAALAAALPFDAVALSPVAPLGLNAVLGPIDQNTSLATIRGTEVLADPTTALALEAALRRRGGVDPVRLCSVDRVLRLQSFPEGWTQHFGLFSLVTAGRATADHGFGLDALRDHIGTYLRLLASLRDRGYDIAATAVEVRDRREDLLARSL